MCVLCRVDFFFDLLICMYKSVQSDGESLLSTYLHNRPLIDSSYNLVSDVLGF